MYEDETETWAVLPEPDDVPEYPGRAVWMDDRLIVVGGTGWNDNDGERSKGVWQYTP